MFLAVSSIKKLLADDTTKTNFSFRRMRFYDLRHTCASLLVKEGVPMKQIPLWLRHSTFFTTADIYAHLDDSAQITTGAVASNMFSVLETDVVA